MGTESKYLDYKSIRWSKDQTAVEQKKQNISITMKTVHITTKSRR